MKKVKLICVTGDNNNKFYNMEEQADGTFHAKYGRVGGRETVEVYPMSKWDTIYRKKTDRKDKPYRDVTELFVETKTSATHKEISSSIIRRLIGDLQKFAKQSVADNYTVSSAAVTEKQVDQAQVIIDRLAGLTHEGESIKAINQLLIDLYSTIPRKLKHVKEHLVQNGTNTIINRGNIDFLKSVITLEQQTLDVMCGQVQTPISEDDERSTILESLGLEAFEIDDEEKANIIKHLGDSSQHFKSAIRLVNERTQGAFENTISQATDKTKKLFWHGSRNENWFNIVNTGLLIRPSNAISTGAMFNEGIYFAPKARKSIGYTSLEHSYWARGNAKTSFLAVYNVHIGNPLHLRSGDSFNHATNYNWLHKQGYNSVWAHEGHSHLRNDEVIVYSKEQCTIKYLVEIKA